MQDEGKGSRDLALSQHVLVQSYSVIGRKDEGPLKLIGRMGFLPTKRARQWEVEGNGGKWREMVYSILSLDTVGSLGEREPCELSSSVGMPRRTLTRFTDPLTASLSMGWSKRRRNTYRAAVRSK